jgi:hypothetical protein
MAASHQDQLYHVGQAGVAADSQNFHFLLSIRKKLSVRLQKSKSFIQSEL